MTQYTLQELARKRWQMAIGLSVLMLAIYFGFILLIAFNKQALGMLIIPGLSVGIVLGVAVIISTWAITFAYVHWAARHIDHAVLHLKDSAASDRQ